jgi:hemolysin-activating ACP:hemolysin acyltransferase
MLNIFLILRSQQHQQPSLHSHYQNLSPADMEQAFYRFRQEYQKPIQLKFVFFKSVCQL